MMAMAALLLTPPASALPDHLTVVTTNPHTGAPATLELDRYSLRAPNWEARIYSSATTYTVLPANQVPEVTTYRGRVVEDGGMVYGGVRPNGTLYAKVNYGCRDSNLPIFCDPYESSNRYSWVIWSHQLTGQTVSTGYVYAPAANEPVTAPAPPANWFNNLGATQNFGGPPPYNNMVTMPLNRVRLLCSANQGSLGIYNNSIAYTLLGMESAVNEADYVAARDGGVSYQIQASGVQTYPAGDVDTSADWSNMAGKYDIMCWTANWGVSGGSWVIDYPEDMSGETMVHELGHSLGGPDFCGELDYQGNMRNTEHGNGGDEMNGVDLYRCLAARANQGYLKNAGYVYYRTPVPTRANPDFASTSRNTPVSVDVLLNDWHANTTNRADLSIVSFQNPSERGGTVTATYKVAPNLIVTVPPGLSTGAKYRLVFVTSTTRDAISINELGRTVDVFVWTGTIGQGTKWGGHPLGDAPGWVIHGDSLGTVSTLTDRDVYGHGWVGNVGNAGGGDNPNPCYAISGIITVPAPSNTYPIWAAAHASGQAANSDSNHNGVPNGGEYFMGATAANPATLPPLVGTAGTWTWTIPYDPTAAASYYFEVSTNLQSWTSQAPGNPAITVLTSQARIRFTLPSGMRFCRLVVTP